MMMNSKKQLSELLSAMHFPRKGDTLDTTKVLASSAVLENDILKYEVVFPKGTKTKQVPTLLKKFFSMQVIPSHDNLVVRHHDYTVKPKAGNVAVVGAMHIPPVVRANPSVQDFDQDYSKMEMTNPETYFRKHDTAPLNSPQFRAKMFTFVSMMGENYGYGTDKHIFHRRASLIMPKIKITKAVPQAKMMYHTHPSKDEPSLSSPDDYLLYMDLSHKPRSIRHFYTVMADRMDYFTVKPKKNSKENYVKLNEDKILKELTDEMDDIEAKWDKKTPKTGDYQDDLRFCENITRDFVKWLNKRYSKYFTITYKCYYKVKKNPPEPEIEDLHLGDELLEKSLDSIKSRDYTWTPSVKARAHEGSAYWHQLRYLDTLGNSAKTLGISPQGSMKRAYDTYMNKAFEESKFSYYDALNILNLAHDISSADSKIRDGGELSSRLTDICSYLELDETSTETLLFLEEVIHNENLFTDEAKTMCGDFYGLALLSSYAIQAVGAIQSVKEGKKEYSVVEYEVYSSLKEETQKQFEEFLLGEKDHRGYAMGENAPASRGFVDSFLNPPTVIAKRADFEHVFSPKVFAYDFDLVKEALDEFNVEKYEPAKSFVTGRNALNLRFPVTTGKVSMTIQPSTGTAQIFVTRRPNPMEDALDAVTKVGTAFVRYGLPGVDPEEYDVKAIDAAQNPQTSQVIAIAGPSGAGKSTTIRNLLKLLPNSKTAPTVTTRAKRKSDKPGERIFISVEQFKKEMTQDKLVAAELQKNGNYYGRRKSDFKGADYVIIDVNPRGVNAIKRAYPNAFTVYLEPVEDPEFIRKRLLRRGDMSPQEARGRASIIPAHIKDSKNIDFDARIKTKQGEFAKIALEIEPMIPKQNPSALTGRMIKRIFNPLKSKMAERKMSAEEASDSRLERADYQRKLKDMEFLDKLSPEERQRYELPEAVEYLNIRESTQYERDLTPEERKALAVTPIDRGSGSWSSPTTTKSQRYGSQPEDFIEYNEDSLLKKRSLRPATRPYGVSIGGGTLTGFDDLIYEFLDITSDELDPYIMVVGNVKHADKQAAKAIFMDAVNIHTDMKSHHVFDHPKLYEGHLIREMYDAYQLAGTVNAIDHEYTHRADESSYTLGIDFSRYDEYGNIVEKFDPDDQQEKYREDRYYTDMAESSPQMVESLNWYTGLATQFVANDTYLIVAPAIRKMRPSEYDDFRKRLWEEARLPTNRKYLSAQSTYWRMKNRVYLFVVKAKTSFLAEKKVKALIEESEGIEGTVFVNPSSGFPHLNEVRGVEFYTSIPNFKHENLGAASAEIAVDRNIPKELVTNVQDIFEGLIEDYEKKTDKRVALGMAFAIDELVEEVNKRGGNAIINLSVETGGSIGIPLIDLNKTVPATIIMTGDVVKKSAARKNPSKKPKTIRIEESPNKEKKLVAYFYDKDGKKIKTTHFGARGMSDFTQHKDPSRKDNYLARHGGMGENWKDPTTAGALSRWILWGKPSLRESFNDFKKRFKLEGVMAVTNTKSNPIGLLKKKEEPSEAVLQGVSLYRELWESEEKERKWDAEYDGEKFTPRTLTASSWDDDFGYELAPNSIRVGWQYMEELFPLAKYLEGTLDIDYYDINGVKLKDFDTLKEAVNSDEIRKKKMYAKDPKRYPWLKDTRYFDYDDVNVGFAEGHPSYRSNYRVTFTKRNLKRFQKLLDEPKKNPNLSHSEEEEYCAIHLNGGVGLFVGSLLHEEHIGEIAKSLDEVILVDPMMEGRQAWRDDVFKALAPDTKSTAFVMSIEEYLDKHELPELSLVHFPHRPSSATEYKGRLVDRELSDESVLSQIEEHTNESTIFLNVPGHERTNPHHCPIEVEARRAASDKGFKHHKWYIEHHLDYVMAIAKAIVNSDEEEDQQLIHDMVWMHDYPKMLGDNDNFELVRELVSKHRSERYTDRLMNQLRWMEEIKSPDWSGRTTTIAAVMSTADALAHYYGPFWQIYLDENPDTPIAELKKSNAKKLEKDKNKLRAGPMEDGLDSVKFQYKGRKVRVVGNEHIAELIARKNPMAPGYQSYGWTTQDWRSIKVNNKGDIDYSEKCGAEGTKTPSGSPRLCLPAAVVKSLIRTESGKDVIRTQARKKARAKKGERVPWHPRIKKIWKRIEDKTVKDKPNPPSFISARDPQKWADRYDKIIKMSGDQLMELAEKQAAEKGLRVELEVYDGDYEKMTKKRRDFPLPPKYEKLYRKFIESKQGVDILLYRGKTLVDELNFGLITESPKELFDYLESRKRWPKTNAFLPHVANVYKRSRDEPATLRFKEFFTVAAYQNKKRFPFAVAGGGGYQMSEGQKGKGYYGIIKTYQAGFLEANNMEQYGMGASPMRSDLYQSYGWLTAFSYKDNYPYPSKAAEYYLNVAGKSKLANKDADYWNVYRPVYSRKMTGAEYRAGVKKMLDAATNPPEWRHGEFAEEDPFEEYF